MNFSANNKKSVSGASLASSVRASAQGSSLVICVEGRFDFHCHKEFRKACEEVIGTFTECVVDLRGTEYLDSSALGMLLVLRESLGGVKVRVTNCRPSILKILQIANFNSLFTLE